MQVVHFNPRVYIIVLSPGEIYSDSFSMTYLPIQPDVIATERGGGLS